jgi:hypothetical protein
MYSIEKRGTGDSPQTSPRPAANKQTMQTNVFMVKLLQDCRHGRINLWHPIFNVLRASKWANLLVCRLKTPKGPVRQPLGCARQGLAHFLHRLVFKSGE